MPSVPDIDGLGPTTTSGDLNLSWLRKTASWIRDDLDPLVAREGPNALRPDDVLTLHSLLLALRTHPASVPILRFSRIHLAIRDICGKATRWPGKLVDEADNVIEQWESTIGPLRNIRTPLYEPGGRLHGICEPRDTECETLVQRFASQDPKLIDNDRAYFHGNLGFSPGKWWINGMFAFRDGIINSMCTEGGITFTPNGVYAVVMRGGDETNAPSPAKFTYCGRAGDAARFRLTSADFRSRYPVRVLRDHRLTSPWAPQAGIRYDGLYKVAGWTIRPVDPDKNEGHAVRFEVHFESQETAVNWDKILQIPTAEETDDFKIYKILHREQCEFERREAREVFESMALVPAATIPQPESSFRSQSLNQISAIRELDGKESSRTLDQSTNGDEPWISDSGHFPTLGENRTSMDGSSDKDLSQLSITQSRRLGYPSGLFIPLPESIAYSNSTRNLPSAPLSFAAVEPFITSRIHYKAKDHPLDSSTNTLTNSSSQVIDTRFRPVNWNPAPRLSISPAFELTDEELREIAPFSDLRRKSSMDTSISPRTSIIDFRGHAIRSKRLGRGSVNEPTLEYIVTL